MNKLNNRGVTLVELLVSLTILAVFMTSITYFITTMSRGTTTAKKQVQVQQDAQKLYEDISQMIMQARCVVIKTDEVIAASSGATPTSADASSNGIVFNNAHYVDANTLMDIGKFDHGYMVSKSSMKTMLSAVAKYRYGTDPDALDNFIAANGTDYAIGATGRYSIKKDNATSKYKIKSKLNTISTAQYETTKMCLDGVFSDINEPFTAFQPNEYNVQGIYLGPVTVSSDGASYTRHNTLVYDGNKIYLNRNETGPDFGTHKENVLVENCYNFSVIPGTGDLNSLYLKLVLVSGGAEGDVDTTYSGDANTVTRKTAIPNGEGYYISKSGYTYTMGGTVNIRNANVMN